MSGLIKMLILDVLKSQQPGVETFAKELTDLKGITSVSITVLEVDAKTETLKVSMQGQKIDLEQVRKTIKHLGGTVHSVDKVIASNEKFKDNLLNIENE